MTVTADGGSGADPDAAGRGQTFPQALACANAVVEGDLASVRPADQGGIQVPVSVDRWFKPSTGPATAKGFAVVPAIDGSNAPWAGS
ncbi:hypothetical protein JBE04_00160 [Streptomyces sp. PRKS01-29]|nr:hypothetical protein [Streptomyces sabulosicollis]MBI0292950.1 hypothetical protein [Streptomyces sabulosicollis]